MKPYTLRCGNFVSRSFTSLERAIKAGKSQPCFWFVVDNRIKRYKRGIGVVAGNDPSEPITESRNQK